MKASHKRAFVYLGNAVSKFHSATLVDEEMALFETGPSFQGLNTVSSLMIARHQSLLIVDCFRESA